jgi:hypothetical protein
MEVGLSVVLAEPRVSDPTDGEAVNPAMEVRLVYAAAAERDSVQEVVDVLLLFAEDVRGECLRFALDELSDLPQGP